ncbi:lytic transglycosylase domain-containing protein [Actinophytocola sp.]|uniref:lytic transglycosylase domain-containing protein n=1 Tax=Actinophytocola sp. TaxID=1872138 RepID=UPI002D7FEA49|nr:lytic murein transglycosylase [Actinophytocola sp.]HET9140149.1 lytic murein transglycosylase [Actinophytocola sp.]HEU5107254.1 lytic murein transglycosylase [Micromonosporaceae bacterium]
MTLVLLAVVLAAAGFWLLRLTTAPADRPAADAPAWNVPAVQVEPGSAAPADLTEPRPQAGTAGADPLRAWADRMAGPTGIPARALLAYGNAEIVLRSTGPGCRLSWATLAGIGRVESNHGQYGGATLGADGRPSKPVIGVPLDGSAGVRAVPDTDGGALDGDAALDRAVGPMQFIPSTWRAWAADGNSDGRADPQQLDDAALSAARYLCAGGRDLATGAGWWAGVLSYNNSVPYGQKVFGLADGYARTAAAMA